MWGFAGSVEHAVPPKLFDLDKPARWSIVQQQLSVFRVAVIWGCVLTPLSMTELDVPRAIQQNVLLCSAGTSAVLHASGVFVWQV